MVYRMYGETVQLFKYKITYETKETVPGEDGGLTEQTVTQTMYCVSDEHRDEFIQYLCCGNKPHIVEAVDQTGNEWIDGMEFKDADQVPGALEMGEIAYRQYVNDNNINLQFSKYLTDLDFRLLLLEWGIV
jgi:hypothetical protein